MTVVKGEQNSWQVGLGHAEKDMHVIAKCGSHTGHVVRSVAFCDTTETATLLVDALKLIDDIYDQRVMGPTLTAQTRALLERAGLL